MSGNDEMGLRAQLAQMQIKMAAAEAAAKKAEAAAKKDKEEAVAAAVAAAEAAAKKAEAAARTKHMFATLGKSCCCTSSGYVWWQRNTFTQFRFHMLQVHRAASCSSESWMI
jgi:hypothetical protein